MLQDATSVRQEDSRTVQGRMVGRRVRGVVQQDKYSTKGLSKRHNTIDKEAFLEVLTSRRSGSGKNRGFRVYKSAVMTYVQERAALTYFFAKRAVHEDGLSTGPTDV